MCDQNSPLGCKILMWHLWIETTFSAWMGFLSLLLKDNWSFSFTKKPMQPQKDHAVGLPTMGHFLTIKTEGYWLTLKDYCHNDTQILELYTQSIMQSAH